MKRPFSESVDLILKTMSELGIKWRVSVDQRRRPWMTAMRSDGTTFLNRVVDGYVERELWRCLVKRTDTPVRPSSLVVRSVVMAKAIFSGKEVREVAGHCSGVMQFRRVLKVRERLSA